MKHRIYVICLLVMGMLIGLGCGAPRYHPVIRSRIPKSDQIKLLLSVSDTVFQDSSISYYRMNQPGDPVSDSLMQRRLGPQLYVWIHNVGPEMYLPVPKLSGYSYIDLAYRHWPSPVEIVYSFNGKQIDSTTFDKMLFTPARSPCDGYAGLLTHVGSNGSLAFPWSIDFLSMLDRGDISPGEYEVSIVLQSTCTCAEDKRPMWFGRTRSNTVRFRIE